MDIDVNPTTGQPAFIADIDINPAINRGGWLIERNIQVTDLRLARIAEMYANAETDNQHVINWARLFWGNKQVPWLLLTGPVGTGKTHAAIAALRLAVQVPRTVVWTFATCSQMLDDFRPGGPDDADAKYLRSDLLIIDDIAMVKANTEWAIEQAYRVIDDRRRNHRPTIITSNELPAKLKELLNEQIVSRIVQDCVAVAVTGADRRRTPKES